MSSPFSRRGRIRAVSFFAAVLVIVCGVAIQERYRADQLQRTVSNAYLHAFSEVTASLDRMDAALQKGQYVTSAPMFCSLCSEISAQATAAQMALGQLPMANVELEQTAAFLATVGDYAQALSRSAALEGTWTEEDRDNWSQLSQAAQTLSRQLDELELELFDGSFSIDDVAAAQARLSAATEETEEPVSGFQSVEADFPELPSLVYDGPFSQHLTDKTPLALEGLDEITGEEALTVAQELLGDETLTVEGTVEGNIPTYTLSGETDSGRRTVSITRRGEKLLSLVTQGTPAEQNLTPEQGIQAARTALERLGFGEMGESYYSLQSNILTVNFCALQDGAYCYPDLVKVSVSMADGSLLGFEAQGYLTNHHQRTLESPAVSQEEAQEMVADNLSVLSVRQAVVPSQGEYERLCWEFLCETEEGGHVIVYVNAQTGAEEKILLLLEDEHGTLAM
ncbi:MAG: germination protein YpeB [Clostridiales bacterium]|nr:germination protein YpeB [Clostridiales bacterium]